MTTIVQISQADRQGGAEAIAQQLWRKYRDLGHSSWLVTARKTMDDPQILPLLADTPTYKIQQKLGQTAQALKQQRGGWRLGNALAGLVHPQRTLDNSRGYEDFAYPATWRFLDRLPHPPDILHAHNLHGGYFDLRALPTLARRVPFMLTLHDAWLLAGHCGHSFECERWQTGCGHCPDLTIYPAIQRDATAHNWRVKALIYQQTRLYLATPCQWLMDKVKNSMLQTAIVEQRVIPYGVNTEIFHPSANKSEIRDRLGIPQHVRVVLFAANGIRQNPFKDYRTMRTAIEQVAASHPNLPLWFIALGENAPDEQLSEHAIIRFVPFQTSLQAVVDYYGAADLYLHAARADTFPNTVLEALSCGLPVIATSVGGIPEQVKSLAINRLTEAHPEDQHDANGILVPNGDAAALAQAILTLLQNDTLRAQLSANAITHIQHNFSLAQHVAAYLDWYAEILDVQASV